MEQIAALCKKHKVLQFFVFGSVLTERFGRDSDVDFTVVFDREALDQPLAYGANYFDFKSALEELLKRDVDLVVYHSFRKTAFVPGFLRRHHVAQGD